MSFIRSHREIAIPVGGAAGANGSQGAGEPARLGTATALVTRVGPALEPAHALARAREAAEGIGEIVWAGLNPAPHTPLNVDIGPHRRFDYLSSPGDPP